MSKFIQTLEIKRRIDDPRYWAEPDVTAQPDFDLPAYQKALDRVCGKTREEFSIVRVVWAWDTEKCFSLIHTGWDIENNPTESELRAKYLYKTIELGPADTVDIPPPRFVFEELIHPAQYFDAWERNRWQFDKKLGRKVPVRPPAPKKGYYRFLFYAAIHDPGNACCKRALKASDECFGLYRLPSQADLDYLREKTGQLARFKKRRNPYEAFGPEVMEAILKETEAIEAEEYEQKMIREEEDRREFESIIQPARGFSLPTKTTPRKTEGGIYLP